MPCRQFKSYRAIPYFELKPPSLKHMFTRICRINIISFQTKGLQVSEADHCPIFLSCKIQRCHGIKLFRVHSGSLAFGPLREDGNSLNIPTGGN